MDFKLSQIVRLKSDHKVLAEVQELPKTNPGDGLMTVQLRGGRRETVMRVKPEDYEAVPKKES
jgi:hypothetical protein